MLVVANLSRHVQPVTLELDGFAGLSPVEVLGRAVFPPVGNDSYTLTVGPHDIYWFSLQPPAEEAPEARPRISVRGGDLDGVWRARGQLHRALVSDISHRRWFRSKSRTIRESEILDMAVMPGSEARVALVHLMYLDGDPETYVMPLALASGPAAERLQSERPEAIIADVAGGEEVAYLYDAMQRPEFPRELVHLASRRRKIKGRQVSLSSVSMKGSSRLRGLDDEVMVRNADAEQTNTSVFIGDELIMKLFRKVEAGANPEVEVGRFLTEGPRFGNTPRAAGLINAEINGEESAIAFFQDLVPSQENLFEHTFDGAVLALETILASGEEIPEPPPRVHHPLDVTEEELDAMGELLGAYLVEAELLGQRTAEMHLALASDRSDPVFAPEPLSTLQQRSTYQAIRSTVRTSLGLLRRRRSRLRPEDADRVDRAVELESEILERLKEITAEKIHCERIRIHGDYHLGQVLFTGNDFYIIDFEGEPQRPLSQRRLKRLALRDVAGMIRSYHYAIVMALHQVAEAGIGDDAYEVLGEWANAIHVWLSAAFLRGYLATVDGSAVIPSNPHHVRLLLDALVVEKAAYELEYEVNNRPDWVEIPLQGILNTVS